MLTDDPRAELERLMDTYGHQLLRMCTLYLKDVSLAEDAVQETFLKAYRKLATFRGDAKESTWLTGIAINVCRDMLRTGWFRRVARDVDVTRLPERAHADEYDDGAVLAAVMALPRPQREVILLRYYQNMTLQETADALHLALSTVKQRQRKANAALRERLKEWYYDE